MNLQLLSKSSRSVIGLVVAAGAITSALAFYGSQFGTVGVNKSSQPAQTIPLKITALGRLEPAAEVIQLAAPLDLDGDRITQLLVKQGDHVKAGQVVAILDSHDRLQDELRQAQEQVKLTQAKLNQIKAGAKTGVITSQAFLGELRGVISQIGLQVNRQNVFSNQPGENLDRRVVEVKISLSSADSKRVAGLTNLQVQTAIQL